MPRPADESWTTPDRLAYLRNLVRQKIPPSDVDDVFQDACVRAVDMAARYGETARNWHGLLYKAAQCSIKDHLDAKRIETVPEEQSAQVASKKPPDYEDLWDRWLFKVQTFFRYHDKQRVNRSCSELLVAYLDPNVTFVEISSQLGISANDASKRWKRCKSYLEEALKVDRDWFEDQMIFLRDDNE